MTTRDGHATLTYCRRCGKPETVRHLPDYLATDPLIPAYCESCATSMIFRGPRINFDRVVNGAGRDRTESVVKGGWNRWRNR